MPTIVAVGCLSWKRLIGWMSSPSWVKALRALEGNMHAFPLSHAWVTRRLGARASESARINPATKQAGRTTGGNRSGRQTPAGAALAAQALAIAGSGASAQVNILIHPWNTCGLKSKGLGLAVSEVCVGMKRRVRNDASSPAGFDRVVGRIIACSRAPERLREKARAQHARRTVRVSPLRLTTLGSNGIFHSMLTGALRSAVACAARSAARPPPAASLHRSWLRQAAATVDRLGSARRLLKSSNSNSCSAARLPPPAAAAKPAIMAGPQRRAFKVMLVEQLKCGMGSRELAATSMLLLVSGMHSVPLAKPVVDNRRQVCPRPLGNASAQEHSSQSNFEDAAVTHSDIGKCC